jgi:hypothetical protein
MERAGLASIRDGFPARCHKKAGINGWRDQKRGNGWLTETVKEGASRKYPAFSKDAASQ